MRPVTLLLLLALSVPAAAQVHPTPAGGDPHLQVVEYDASQIVMLRGSPGYQLMVELSADEQVQTVAIGDPTAWQVSVNKAGDRLFIKPAHEAPTNMTVVTSVRVYNFELVPQPSPTADLPYTVQFRYPAPKQLAGESEYVDVSAAARRLSRYRVSGDRLLWPTSITDDGRQTYISWSRSAAIPAVYAVDQFGKEVLANGMMGTDDVFVIDGAPMRLSFRMDDRSARAVRINPRKRR